MGDDVSPRLEGRGLTKIANEYGSVEIDPRGGRVRSWVPSGGAEIFYQPPDGTFDEVAWSHGGIPLCFPWFGTTGPEGSPLHGLVRSREWKGVSVTDASAVLEMESDPAMAKWFDGRFRLRLAVTLAASLDLRLTVENAGSDPFAYTNGFHPYFRVGDCTKATVDGVDGCRYWYGPGFGAMPWKGPVTFGEKRDHVFWLDGHRQVLNDPVLGRCIVVESSGNSRLVVWNPGSEGSPGLPPGDWRRFVCVEPATIPAEDGFTILPGERQSFGMTISVGRN